MLYHLVLLQAGPNGGSGFSPMTFVFMGAIFAVMYFFMIRPQQKKANEQKDFIKALKKGDRIVTIGGIHGRIIKDNEDTLLVEVDNNVKLKIERSAISMENTQRLNTDTGNKEKEVAPAADLKE